MRLKVMILVILVLLCLLCAVSCNLTDTNINNLEDSLTESSYAKDTNTDNEDLDIDAESIYLTSVEEYYKFIETDVMPNDFITYDMLKDIGDLQSFVIPDRDYLSYYGYHLSDENGFLIDVFITHLEEAEKGSLVATDTVQLQAKPIEGFLYGKEFDNNKVFYNDIQYTYSSNGSLRYITTIINSVKISISPSSIYDSDLGKVVELDFVDYKPSTENLITYLISGNEDNVDIARYLAGKSQK